MTAIELLAVARVEPLHERGQVGQPGVQHEVIVIAHQAVGEGLRAIGDERQQEFPVTVVREDRRALHASRGDVIDGIGVFQAHRSRHVASVAPPRRRPRRELLHFDARWRDRGQARPSPQMASRQWPRALADEGGARPLRQRRAPVQPGFDNDPTDAVGAGAGSPQPPPSARIRPTVAWYCAARTCTAARRLASSLRRASRSSSWLTRPLR